MYRTGREMEQSELDYWRNPMLLKLFYSFMDIFFSQFFQLLTLTSWGKSVNATGKSALILVKLPNIKVIPRDTS